MTKRDTLIMLLLIQTLVMPYHAVYSLAILFVFFLPTWANVALWGLVIAGTTFMQSPPWFIIPLALLLYTLSRKRISSILWGSMFQNETRGDS